MKLKRWTALLLAVLLLIGTAPVYAAEPNAQTAETPEGVYTETYTWVNPLYADAGLTFDEPAACAETASPYFPTVEEAGAYYRELAIRRAATISFSVGVQGSAFSVDGMAVLNEILDAAYTHPGGPKGGDFLRYQVHGYRVRYGPSGNAFSYSFTMYYFTDAQQEAELDRAVAALLPTLQLDGKTSYEKVKTIHDYICGNIQYAYGSSDPVIHSAYAALVNKRAVCQGYAALFYLLATEAGVETRIISGIGNGGDHAWNIVRLGSKYYDLDTTWDAQRFGVIYNYFLCGSRNFGDHQEDAEYKQPAFTSTHPISTVDYDPNNAEPDPTSTPKPTATPTPKPTATPTPKPTATPTPKPTATPTPKPTATPTPKPTATPTPKPTAAPTSYRPGDVTGDGKITSADALQIQRYVVKRSSVLDNAEQKVLDAADVTKDGQITSADALQIQRYVVQRPSVLDGK